MITSKTIIASRPVPAWMSMMTGKNPGRLGFYGFRNRTSYAYEELGLYKDAIGAFSLCRDAVRSHAASVFLSASE